LIQLLINFSLYLDLLYRQTLAVSHGSSLDIEIVDISSFISPNPTPPIQSSSSGFTSTSNLFNFNVSANATPIERKTFPVEEMHRADGFVIVYSITDRSSFSTALDALNDIHACYNNMSAISGGGGGTLSSSPASPSASSQSNPKPSISIPIALIGNKSDLEHIRTVEKAEGFAASVQYNGCQFYELSVAENSPEVYSSFQSLITGLIALCHTPPKRKFSMSKMLGTLRLGRNSPSNALPVPTAPASITDTNVDVSSPELSASFPNSPAKSRESSPGFVSKSLKKGKSSFCSKHGRQGSSDSSSSSSTSTSSSSSNSISSSICNLKSKLVELHSMKKRQNSPPICSL
jgi:hypothetical protein